MSILDFEPTEKVMSREERESYVADSAPPGVYQPNMSKADQNKWKAKLIGGKFPRVEIRKTIGGVQMVIIVTEHTIKQSMNGKARFSMDEWMELNEAVSEAHAKLI